MITVTNAGQVGSQLDQWIAEVEQLAMEVARGLAIEAFTTLLKNSAQSSGDFVANWNVSVNEVNTEFEPFDTDRVSRQLKEHGTSFVQFIQGAGPAMNEARRRNAGRLSNLQLGDTIYISNSSAHDQPYALLIEGDALNWRSGNSGAPVAKTLGYMQGQYSDVQRPAAIRLSGRKL